MLNTQLTVKVNMCLYVLFINNAVIDLVGVSRQLLDVSLTARFKGYEPAN